MINYADMYLTSLILATFLYIIYRFFVDIDPEMDAFLYLICFVIAITIVGVIGFIKLLFITFII